MVQSAIHSLFNAIEELNSGNLPGHHQSLGDEHAEKERSDAGREADRDADHLQTEVLKMNTATNKKGAKPGAKRSAPFDSQVLVRERTAIASRPSCPALC